MKRGWIHCLLLVLCALMFGAAPVATSPATTPAARKAVVIVIRGEINEYTQEALAKRIGQAKQLGADTVILQLDTYGGLVTSGLEMSSLLKNQPGLHIIAWVPEKAISAGAMIALACDEIVMGPSAKMGDSAPISISEDGGLQPLPEAERAKAESPILEDFRDSARRHGYDPLLVESMVSVNRTVFWVENAAGERRFVNQADFNKLIDSKEWHIVPGVRSPIDPSNELLTVSTDLAIKLGLAKGMATDAQSLANERGLTIIATLAPSGGEIFLRWFGSSLVRGLLLVTFLVSLYVALHIPGHGAPEAIATISLALLLGVPWLTGYAQWWEILLIFSGLALLAIEIFVIPGHGLAAIPGALIMLFGFLMTFVPKEPSGLPGFLPSLEGTWVAVQNGLMVMVAGLFSSLMLGVWLRKYLPKLPYFNKLILSSPVGTFTSVGESSETAAWPQPGARGRTETDLKPGGSATFIDPAAGDRRLFSVVSDRGYVSAGEEVVVQESGGGRLVVRPV